MGNPIAHCYHYRIMAIAACGKHLRMIDNEPVRKPELDRALALGKVGILRGYMSCRYFLFVSPESAVTLEKRLKRKIQH